MAGNKVFRLGPVAMSAVLTTNILNPATLTGGVGVTETKTYVVLKHIRIVNKTIGPVTFSLWLGATGANAAGTEVIGQGLSVPPNSYIDWFGLMYFDTADFLVGGASVGASLTLEGEGEIGVAD